MADFAMATAFDAVAAALPSRACILAADGVHSYEDVRRQSTALGRTFVAYGIAHDGPVHSAPHEVMQPRVGILAHNCPEFVEAMLGAYRARAVPFNVNYRYVEEELRYLLRDAEPTALVVQSSLAERVAPVLDDLPGLPLIVQIEDEPGVALLPGAISYGDAIRETAAVSFPEPQPDDLYLLYTGGTTGMPKGVIWRQADILVRGMACVDCETGREFDSLEDLAAHAQAHRTSPDFVGPPLMHGAGQWLTFRAMLHGVGAALAARPRSFDPVDVLDRCVETRSRLLLIVGDAFAGPLIRELRRRPRQLPDLEVILTGGVALSDTARQDFHDLLPEVRIVDTAGSSETGGQMSAVIGRGVDRERAVFEAREDTVVLATDRHRVLDRGEVGRGWLASTGRIPLGYKGDPTKTAATFVVLDDMRYSIPGDMAEWVDERSIRLLGRDSVTVNSGGEKIFVEEVEAALRRHPAVEDVVVCGVPDERWGERVAAVVSFAHGCITTEQELRDETARFVASYKVPKTIVFVSEIRRGPAGKPDYQWARVVAAAEAGPERVGG